MNAPDLLQAAAKHMADRAKTYDKPEGERSMGKAVAMFNACTERDLTEAEGWLLLQCLKDVRLFQRPGYHADSAEDCIAYAALKAEAKAAEAISTCCGSPHTCKRQCPTREDYWRKTWQDLSIAVPEVSSAAIDPLQPIIPPL